MRPVIFSMVRGPQLAKIRLYWRPCGRLVWIWQPGAKRLEMRPLTIDCDLSVLRTSQGPRFGE